MIQAGGAKSLKAASAIARRHSPESSLRLSWSWSWNPHCASTFYHRQTRPGGKAGDAQHRAAPLAPSGGTKELVGRPTRPTLRRDRSILNSTQAAAEVARPRPHAAAVLFSSEFDRRAEPFVVSYFSASSPTPSTRTESAGDPRRAVFWPRKPLRASFGWLRCSLQGDLQPGSLVDPHGPPIRPEPVASRPTSQPPSLASSTEPDQEPGRVRARR